MPVVYTVFACLFFIEYQKTPLDDARFLVFARRIISEFENVIFHTFVFFFVVIWMVLDLSKLVVYRLLSPAYSQR